MKKKEKKPRVKRTPGQIICKIVRGLLYPVVCIMIIIGLVFSSLFMTLDYMLGIEDKGTYTMESDAEVQMTDDWDPNDSLALAYQIQAEGSVLLRNENNTLPMEACKVNLFGATAVEPHTYGNGSGSTSTTFTYSDINNTTGIADFSVSAPDLKEAMEYAGFTVNPELWQFYKDNTDETVQESNWGEGVLMDTNELPVSVISDASVANINGQSAIENAVAYSDVAVYIFSIPSSEHADYVAEELTFNEDELATLKLLRENFETVIVLVNCGNYFSLAELEEIDVDAILWIGLTGINGLNAAADILTGKVNPSGKLSDIYPYDPTSAPGWINTGIVQYVDEETVAPAYFEGVLGLDTVKPYLIYAEGIYNGYKWYETAAAEGVIDYDSVVQYPFGYGLSYTTFDWEVVESDIDHNTQTATVSVKVTNTGDVAGKEVVQLYNHAPYYNGGIEKAEVSLVEFAKTDELAPGESQVVTMTVDFYDLCSYDYVNVKGYILEAGDYELRIQRDSHTVEDVVAFTVEEDILFPTNENTGVTVTNLFDDVGLYDQVTYLSRADGFANYDEAIKTYRITLTDEQREIASIGYGVGATEGQTPSITTGADNDLQLIELRGLDFDDPKWDEFLDQLTEEELVYLYSSGCYGTYAISRLGVPETDGYDGPAGVSMAFALTGYYGVAYPTQIVIASTWNRDLCEEYGKAIAEECLHAEIELWYAPIVNLHRSHRGGRDFEYYSEDTVLSGILGGYTIKGAEENGLMTSLKHFALYEQSGGQGAMCFINEQAFRETYLKPFEIAINVCEPSNIMTCYSSVGLTWAGANHTLVTDLLYNEWGYEGFTLTDAILMGMMDSQQALSSGTSQMLMTFCADYFEVKDVLDQYPESTLYYMRQAAHRILYATVNCDIAMNGVSVNSTFSGGGSTARVMGRTLTIVGVLGLAGLITWSVLAGKKRKAQVKLVIEQAKAAEAEETKE